MDITEINEKMESFQRTEKALADEHLLYTEKSKKYTNDYREFVRGILKEGWVWGKGGWKRNE